MVHAAAKTESSFWQRSNDLKRRAWPYRLARFVRAQVGNVCAHGAMLAQEPRVAAAWRRGWDAPHFQRLLRWHEEGFRPRVVLDIGAHTGDWAAMCEALFTPDHCVLLEPQRELLEVARRRQPPAAHWQLVPVAVGDVEQEEMLYLTEQRAAASLLSPLREDHFAAATRCTGQVPVQIVRLDTLLRRENLPPPDLIKIDVQGFEAKVIAGGLETLKQTRRLVVETSLRPIYQGQPLLPEVLRMLADLGFKLDDFNEVCRAWPNGRLWQADLWLTRPA